VRGCVMPIRNAIRRGYCTSRDVRREPSRKARRIEASNVRNRLASRPIRAVFGVWRWSCRPEGRTWMGRQLAISVAGDKLRIRVHWATPLIFGISF